MKPYTIESYKAGKKPITRGGYLVEHIYLHEGVCTEYPFSAIIKDKNTLINLTFTETGLRFNHGESTDDLFEAPIKREGWINIYGVDDARNPSHTIHDTEQKAREGGSTNENYITSIKIEWEE